MQRCAGQTWMWIWRAPLLPVQVPAGAKSAAAGHRNSVGQESLLDTNAKRMCLSKLSGERPLAFSLTRYTALALPMKPRSGWQKEYHGSEFEWSLRQRHRGLMSCVCHAVRLCGGHGTCWGGLCAPLSKQRRRTTVHPLRRCTL